MAHDFEQKYVGLVATIIGAVVVLLGIGGLVLNLLVGVILAVLLPWALLRKLESKDQGGEDS
jgi:Flp pilus assembly protein TadB